MLNNTINGSKCQELFLDGSNSVSAEGKSYYRRSDISSLERQKIAVHLLQREGQYGVVTSLSRAYRVSRTFMYNLKETARGALSRALAWGQPGSPNVSCCLEVDKNRVERGIVTLAQLEPGSNYSDYLSILKALTGLATVGCCSIEQTRAVLGELLDVECSMGYISEVLQSTEMRAAEVNAVLLPNGRITVVADEIFDSEVPHLVVVEPSSLMILELSRQENRDSLTWGITWLDCAKRGVEIKQVVSDAAQGLKKGITEAELGIEHHLDLFHTLREVRTGLLRKHSCALRDN